jgi:hypothetical protein
VREYPIERQQSIVRTLVDELPELRASYQEHMSEREGLLPYVYLPDAVRDLEAKAKAGRLPEDFVDRLATALETMLLSDPGSHNLITLGLLEELINTELWSRLKDHLGPRTLHAIRPE